jgi:PAS domain S-box-containing protein
MRTKSSTQIEHPEVTALYGYQAFRALWENSLVAAAFTTLDGRVLAANPAARRLFGRTEEDICKIGRKGLMDPSDKRIFSVLEKSARKGYAEGEVKYLRADGTSFPAHLSSFAFETTEGIKYCSLILDISQLKQAEERVRVFSRQLLSVQEENKQRLSAVLHHEVGSVSVGLTAHLLAVEESLREGKGKRALDSIKECRRVATQAVKRLKALAIELRPPELDLCGVVDALRQYFRELGRISPLRIIFIDATNGVRISPEAQSILFRCVQECLNNVIKHAGAKWARIRLTVTKRLIRLTIADRGKGFDPDRLAKKPGRHLGLQAMQEMAASLGGNVAIESARGQGTTIRVVLPREEQRV